MYFKSRHAATQLLGQKLYRRYRHEQCVVLTLNDSALAMGTQLATRLQVGLVPGDTDQPLNPSFFQNKTVIIVADALDDVTGTIRLARILRSSQIRSLVIATPILSVAAVNSVHVIADDVCALTVVPEFSQPDAYYHDTWRELAPAAEVHHAAVDDQDTAEARQDASDPPDDQAIDIAGEVQYDPSYFNQLMNDSTQGIA